MIFAVEPARPSMFLSSPDSLLLSHLLKQKISIKILNLLSTEKMNVIMMISDGWGPAAATLARAYSKKALNIDPYIVGTVRTLSADRYLE